MAGVKRNSLYSGLLFMGASASLAVKEDAPCFISG